MAVYVNVSHDVASDLDLVWSLSFASYYTFVFVVSLRDRYILASGSSYYYIHNWSINRCHLVKTNE